ncbi:MAG: H-X9-DG-CTERM domain-containing protein [Armatimonadota bacterium]
MLDQCFVVMPIGKQNEPGYAGYDDAIYEKLIPAAIEASGSGLKVVRADHICRQDSITQIIMEQLCRSRLVIADVTWPNPNVWYEVGIRHAVCSSTILMCQSGTILPFDSNDVQTEFYDWSGDLASENAQSFCRSMANKIQASLAASPFAADSLMGRLIDHEMDYWAVLERQHSTYSPSAIVLRGEHSAMQRLCERTLQCIFMSLQPFFADHDDRYGPGLSSVATASDYCGNRLRPNSYGENWLSDLSRYSSFATSRRRDWVCPLSFMSSGYTMNEHLFRWPRLSVRLPARVPFCFDDTLALNAADDYAVQSRHPGGHMVLFCDGTVRAIPNSALRNLKWSPA